MSPSTHTSSGATIARLQHGATVYPSCPIRPLPQAGVALPRISWDELLGRR